MRLSVLPMVWLAACATPPEAPEDLDELTHYLYREWDHEDPAVMRAGVANLMAFFETVDLDRGTAVLERSWELSSVRPEDLVAIDGPDRDPSDTYGVGVAMHSTWEVQDHAAWQLHAEQLPAEPSAVAYERAWMEGTDACFGDRDCPVLITVNEIERQNLVMSLAFTYHKQFRWVELDDGQVAMVSRAWLPESVEGTRGSSQIWQTYNVEAWLPAEGGSHRYQVLWSESDIAGASDAIQIATVKTATNGHFLATDEAIAELP